MDTRSARSGVGLLVDAFAISMGLVVGAMFARFTQRA